MTDPDCKECEGTGTIDEIDRYSSDGLRTVCCECSMPDEDAEYDAWRDSQLE
jgi:hypothetical protein